MCLDCCKKTVVTFVNCYKQIVFRCLEMIQVHVPERVEPEDEEILPEPPAKLPYIVTSLVSLSLNWIN